MRRVKTALRALSDPHAPSLRAAEETVESFYGLLAALVSAPCFQRRKQQMVLPLAFSPLLVYPGFPSKLEMASASPNVYIPPEVKAMSLENITSWL